jgi:pyruvate dehydrogenase E2 component (dihydrolipoamide acetyltransferase)
MYHSGNSAKQLFIATFGKRIVTKRAAPTLAQQVTMRFFVNHRQTQMSQAMLLVSQAHRGFSLPPHIKLEMPNLSPTMEKGNIAKWLKKEGDSIKPGDILAQIETDKATVDFEMQEEGFIAKLMYPEGAKDVKLGQVVAIVVDKKDDVAKFKDFSGATAASSAPASPKAAAPV